MQSTKRILILFTGMSLVVAGFLGIIVVLDVISLADLRELIIRLVMVFGILATVSVGLLLLGHINRQS
jgi:hypothetical protein